MSARIVVPAPTPGVYPGVAMDEHHAWDAASQSRLSRLMRSPAHLRAYIEQPPTDTPALALGRAIHTAVLEPEKFDDLYTLAEQCMATTKAGHRCTNPGVWMHKTIGWVCGVHVKGNEAGIGGAQAAVLSPEDHAVCLGIRDSVAKSTTATGLITGPGQVELSMVWEDRDSGVLCKGRWDRHSPEVAGGAIVDLKTTVSALRRDFERSIFSFNYHAQGGFYLMGAEARRIPVRHYCIIATEKTPPYAVGVYRLTEGAIQAGQELIRPLLKLYAQLREQPPEQWPGYPDEVQDISLPDWAWKVTDERIDEIERSAA